MLAETKHGLRKSVSGIDPEHQKKYVKFPFSRIGSFQFDYINIEFSGPNALYFMASLQFISELIIFLDLGFFFLGREKSSMSIKKNFLIAERLLSILTYIL